MANCFASLASCIAHVREKFPIASLSESLDVDTGNPPGNPSPAGYFVVSDHATQSASPGMANCFASLASCIAHVREKFPIASLSESLDVDTGNPPGNPTKRR